MTDGDTSRPDAAKEDAVEAGGDAEATRAAQAPAAPRRTRSSSSGANGDDPFAHTRMTIGEHLDELRQRLIKGVGTIVVVFCFAYAFNEPIRAFVLRPFDQAMEMLREHWVGEANERLAEDPTLARTKYFVTDDPGDERLLNFSDTLTYLGVAEQFFFTLRICLYAALVVGAPVLLWQMWQFIAAGLYPGERRSILRYFPFSLLAFVSGIMFGFTVIVPYGMYYLNKSPIDFGPTSITAETFLTFLTGLCLSFGLVFQLPLVMTFLGASGMVEPKSMATYRGHFCIGAFALSAMLTPPDPFTQAMMGVPLVVLYEVGIWSARAAKRRRRDPVAVGGAHS